MTLQMAYYAVNTLIIYCCLLYFAVVLVYNIFSSCSRCSSVIEVG